MEYLTINIHMISILESLEAAVLVTVWTIYQIAKPAAIIIALAAIISLV
jgi:hypothetical protein